MKSFKLLCASALLALSCTSAQAALWSLDNVVVQADGATTMNLSLTGNQITSGADVDIIIPKGFKVSAVGLNGGGCAVFRDTVRAIAVYPLSAPFPAVAVPYCQLTIIASPTAVNSWFTLTGALCFDTWANPAPQCERDPGYVTVIH